MRCWRLLLLLAACAICVRAGAAETGIYVIKATGGQERKVVSVDGMKFHGSPRWSHDGKRIAFDAVAEDEGIRKFYVVNLDGSQLQELGEQAMPDWSPDDKQFVFHHDGNADVRKGVWVQNVDGTGREWLVEGACPRWSPDGARIAFTDWRTLKTWDVGTGETQTLFEEPVDEFPHGFDWSRDGKYIGFVARRAKQPARELFILSVDPAKKGMRVRFASEDNLAKHVHWSPDGKRLVITIDTYIYLLDVEGNGPPRRVQGQTDKSRDPSWSPSGEWIVFARRPR